MNVPHYRNSRDPDPDSANENDSEALHDEVTPQPIRIQSNSNSSGSFASAPIARPNFSQEPVPAPSERAPVNGWRELASATKTPKPPSSSILHGLKTLGQIGTSGVPSGSQDVEPSPRQDQPRIVAPLRKLKARSPQPSSPSASQFQSRLKPPSVVNSPQVKVEADESVVMISPPRPPRSPSRIPAPVASRGTTPTPRPTPAPFNPPSQPHEKQQSPALFQQPATTTKSAKSPTKEKEKVHGDEMDLDELTPNPPAPTRLAPHQHQHVDVEMGELSSEPTSSRPLILAPKDPLLNNPPASLAAPAEIRSLPSTTSMASISQPAPDIPSLTPQQVADVARSIAPLTMLLSSDQLDMTLEEFIRAETQKKYTAMKAESEDLLKELMEEGRRKRMVMIEHLRRAPSVA